jgi:predicted Zn-dependent protease
MKIALSKLASTLRKLPYFVSASLMVVAIQPGTASELPELGQDAAAIISPYQERQIGEEAMAQIRQSLDFVDDPELTYYLQHLGAKLTNALPDRPSGYRFFLVANPTINAFALPGGFIGVHTGLVTKARSESELAAVLAHEISHVTQRHWPRLVAAQKDRAGVTLAAILASIVIAGSGNPNGAGVAIAAMAANTDSQLVFTRSFEREADRIGIRLLADSGYDVSAMAGFFERLAEDNRLGGVDVPEFMRTHPVTSSRIAEARGSERRFPQNRTKSSDAFWHFRARTLALYEPDNARVIANFRNELGKSKIEADRRLAARYGIALAFTKQGDYGLARKEISALRIRQPKNLRYRLAEADIELGAANTRKGLALYQYIYKSNSRNSWVIQRYAEVLLANNRALTAVKILKPALQQDPRNSTLNKLLATAAGETGDLIQAHRSMAEYYVINGNPHAAINQLNIAEKKAHDNFYALAAIKARKREIENLLPKSAN